MDHGPVKHGSHKEEFLVLMGQRSTRGDLPRGVHACIRVSNHMIRVIRVQYF
jgi:hypothetical protein